MQPRQGPPQTPADQTPAQKRNRAWDAKAGTFWEYKGDKRDSFYGPCEVFYQQHRHEFRNAIDIGCGTGRHLIPMLQDGLDVVGVEPSPGMREGAEKNLTKAKDTFKGKVEVIEGESKDLSAFPDASFDFVFAKGSIHHNTWEEIRQSFIEVARVLKPGKFFLFQGRSTKDSSLLQSELVSDVGKTAQDTSGFKEGVTEHYFDEDEIRRLGAENGFEIVVGPEEILRTKSGSDKINARWWVVYRKI